MHILLVLGRIAYPYSQEVQVALALRSLRVYSTKAGMSLSLIEMSAR